MKFYLVAIAALVVVLAGCGGGSGTSYSSNAPTPYSSTFMVLQTDGRALGTTDEEPVASNRIVFKRLTSTLYAGVFEVTQQQWFAVMGTTPWSDVPSAVSAPITADAAPAYNISWEQANAFAQELSRRSNLRILLPTEAQWQAMVGSGEYPWGDSLTVTDIAGSAWLQETRSVAGPTTTGGRAKAQSGLYDIVGNVREWTSERTLVGGSWSDNVLLTGRSKRVTSVDPEIQHPLSGLRLIAVP